MMSFNARFFVLFFIFVSQSVFADDKSELNQLLNVFLSGTDSAEQHDRFWADDLIYTSSAGTRFGKADIMAGFAAPKAGESESSSESNEDGAVQSYAAEDVDIRVFGSTAIVAFKLVGSSVSKGATSTTYYFNTGAFVKRNGQWRAVAWQATKIPESEGS